MKYRERIDDSNPFFNRAPRKNDPDFLRRRNTVAGMASWGGQGPIGTQCAVCDHFGWAHRRADEAPPPAPCLKYCRMANMNPRRAPRIEPTQPSCKYFEPRHK
jgi:hypothetical protein